MENTYEEVAAKKLTKEEQVLADARVAAVKAAIAEAAAVRKANNVVETPEETKVREAAEAVALAEAKDKVTPEQKVHLDARDSRVAALKVKIAAAKADRELAEKNGTKETDGAKIDREAKEKKDLAEASRVYVIEPLVLDTVQAELLIVAEKLREVIDCINNKYA